MRAASADAAKALISIEVSVRVHVHRNSVKQECGCGFSRLVSDTWPSAPSLRTNLHLKPSRGLSHHRLVNLPLLTSISYAVQNSKPPSCSQDARSRMEFSLVVAHIAQDIASPCGLFMHSAECQQDGLHSFLHKPPRGCLKVRREAIFSWLEQVKLQVNN